MPKPKPLSGIKKENHIGKTVDVEWDSLGGLNSKTGATTPAIDGYLSAMVRVPGFMVPLEDSANSVKEFLLVPYPQACIHVPAPPPNLIVYVKMESGKPAKARGWDPIWVTGYLELKKSKSIYAESAYQLSGLSVEDYKE